MAINLGELGDRIYAKNEEIAQLNAQLKELDREKREMENKLIAAMEEAGTDIARGERATASISELTRAQIIDWEKLETFVYRKKALHLFEKRISSTAYKELKALLKNKDIPGLNEFTTKRLNLRKV